MSVYLIILTSPLPITRQVHLATLKSGERVVVKVQRPGLKELFDIDLKNIRWVQQQRKEGYMLVAISKSCCAHSTCMHAKVPSDITCGPCPAHSSHALCCSILYVSFSHSHNAWITHAHYHYRALAVWLQKVDPKTDGAARDWVAIYDECSRILYQEIDYTLEGKNADRFRENFANVDWIKVRYWGLVV